MWVGVHCTGPTIGATATRFLSTEEVTMMEDDLREGLVPAYTELLKDEQFQLLLGALATMYGVVNRKVTSIDQRSFKASKERLTAFVARTSGWNAKVSRDTRNGSWRRGSVHPDQGQPRQADQGDLVGVGGRRGGVRSASDAPAEVPEQALQRHASKDRCPACQARAAKVWRMNGQLVCPSCVRKACKP